MGEFPAQNDVNLAPAPSLPQVTQHQATWTNHHGNGLFVDPSLSPSLQPSLVQDMTEFKRSLPLFPLVRPHINFMAAKL